MEEDDGLDELDGLNGDEDREYEPEPSNELITLSIMERSPDLSADISKLSGGESIDERNR